MVEFFNLNGIVKYSDHFCDRCGVHINLQTQGLLTGLTVSSLVIFFSFSCMQKDTIVFNKIVSTFSIRGHQIVHGLMR